MVQFQILTAIGMVLLTNCLEQGVSEDDLLKSKNIWKPDFLKIGFQMAKSHPAVVAWR